MRYHPDDKEKTRQRILRVAARRFRSEGLQGVGIANLMADLGMTHGGFYAHFIDKEALVTATCTEAFSAQQRYWDKLLAQHPGEHALRTLIGDYLSSQHRDHPETGCFAAALASEMARRDNRSRRAFTTGIEQQLNRLERAVSDPALSDRLLSSASEALLKHARD
jgi:TetR/AcrR family transcriptional repressor of nem operon